MSKNFDVVDLYEYYFNGKKLTENELSKLKDEYPLSKPMPTKFASRGIKHIDTRKTELIGHFMDFELKPTSFELEIKFKITFNQKNIQRDFNKSQGGNATDGEFVDSTDEKDIDRHIQMKLKNQVPKPTTPKKPAQATKVITDLDNFYYDSYKKQIPSYAVSKYLNDLIREGKLPMDKFKVTAVNYSGVQDEKNVFETFIKYDKKNQSVKVPFGYMITFAVKDQNDELNNMDLLSKFKYVIDFERQFTKAFELYVLEDNDYYIFTKK